MSSAATPTDDPASHVSQRAEDVQCYRQMLRELAEMGMGIARALHRQATVDGEPSDRAESAEPLAPNPAIAASAAFDRIARTVRRTIALAHKLSEPDPPSPGEHARAETGERRLAARKRLIRGVEDAIQREARGDWAEALNTEFRERLDDPDLDDDLGHMPVNEVVAIICRDLGIAHVHGTHPWKRRTPQDVLDLCALAARPSRDSAEAATTCQSEVARSGARPGASPQARPTPGAPRLISPPPPHIRTGADPPAR